MPLSCAPSTTEPRGARVHPVRPTPGGYFPDLLPGCIRNFYGDVAFGNGTQWKVGAFRTQRGVFVGIEGIGAACFESLTTPEGVWSAFGKVGWGDAGNVA